MSLIQAIPESVEVHFLCLSRQIDKDMRARLEGAAPPNLFYEVFRPSYFSAAFSLVSSILDGRPLQVAMFRSRALEKRLKFLVRKESTCLIVHLVRGLNLVEDSIRSASFLEMTDAISRNYSTLAETANFPFSYVFRREARLLREFEKSAVESTRESWLVSNADIEYLRADGIAVDKVKYVPLKVMLRPSQEFSEPDMSQPTIAFIGNFTSMQNKDGLSWFISEVFPKLVLQFSVRLRVIGRIGEDLILQHAQNGSISFTREVDDVSAEVSGCFLGICPIRIAAGVQTKILEYLALGLPVISSRRCVSALSKDVQALVLSADSPDEYAECVGSLLNRRQKKSHLLNESNMRRTVVLKEHGGEHLRKLMSAVAST